jgi:hypothetical protein
VAATVAAVSAGLLAAAGVAAAFVIGKAEEKTLRGGPLSLVRRRRW